MYKSFFNDLGKGEALDLLLSKLSAAQWNIEWINELLEFNAVYNLIENHPIYIYIYMYGEIKKDKEISTPIGWLGSKWFSHSDSLPTIITIRNTSHIFWFNSFVSTSSLLFQTLLCLFRSALFLSSCVLCSSGSFWVGETNWVEVGLMILSSQWHD